MHRLHIDIPLSFSEEVAKEISIKVIEAILAARSESVRKCFIENLDSSIKPATIDTSLEMSNIMSIGYRLGDDDDRQKSNYFVKDAQDHVSNKKCCVMFNEDGEVEYLRTGASLDK